MKKLAIISCYIGPLPNYFQLFLDSCSWNENIDWHIFGDDDISKFILPPNVRFHNLSFEELKELTANIIGSFRVLHCPYKICDYKPSFGLLFYNYLKDYEYWGHCDLDIIWGDLEKFVLPLLSQDYDRLFKFGHLSIYKNNEEINNLFKLPYSGLNFRDVFSTKISCGFDEEKCTWRLAKENNYKILENKIVFDIKRPGSSKNIEHYGTNHQKQAFLIADGKIVRIYEDSNEIREEERAYLHFQWRPLKKFPRRFSRNGIYQFLGNEFKELSINYNPKELFEFSSDPIKLTYKKRIDTYLKILKFKVYKGKIKILNHLRTK